MKNDWKNKKVERRGKDNALDEYMLNNDSKQINYKDNYKDNLYNTTFLKEKQNMFLRVNGSGSMYFQKNNLNISINFMISNFFLILSKKNI